MECSDYNNGCVVYDANKKTKKTGEIVASNYQTLSTLFCK